MDPTQSVVKIQCKSKAWGTGLWTEAALALILFCAPDLRAQITLTNIGRIPAGTGESHDIAVSGNDAFVANGSDGLEVYDISNPANPVNIGHTNNGGCAFGVAFASNLVYVANLDDGLRIYKVSNPANPVNVGHIFNGGMALNVAVNGNYAYLANDSDGLRIYNVSNPANPVNVGYAPNTNFFRGVAYAVRRWAISLVWPTVMMDCAFTTSPIPPVQPMSATRVAPTSTGRIRQALRSPAITPISATRQDGVRIYDISTPANPTSVYVSFNSPGIWILRLSVSTHYLSFADFNTGLRIWTFPPPPTLPTPPRLSPPVMGRIRFPNLRWLPAIWPSWRTARMASAYSPCHSLLEVRWNTLIRMNLH